MPGLAGRGMVPEPRFEERPGGPRIVREVLGPGAGETSDTASAPAVAPPPGASRSRLARSTVIFSLATGLSRVLGLVREVVAKNYFGVQGPVNAFQIAFLVPNTVRALVADSALSAAFVPVFSDLLEKGERKRAWRVASSLVWLSLLGLGALTALFMVIAPWVMRPLYPDDHALLVGLSLVLFPIVANIAPAALDAAFRIYMLPQGMFSVAIATVPSPSLSRFASRRDIPGFRDTVSLGVRQIAFLLVPASIVTIVLAEPITRLIY